MRTTTIRRSVLGVMSCVLAAALPLAAVAFAAKPAHGARFRTGRAAAEPVVRLLCPREIHVSSPTVVS